MVVPPSPNVQKELTGTGVEILVNVALSFIQTDVGLLKSVVNPPITIGLLLNVSTQPAELVVINVAIKVPLLT